MFIDSNKSLPFILNYMGTSKTCFLGCTLVGTIFTIKPHSFYYISNDETGFRGTYKLKLEMKLIHDD